jgi:hypothetical protein
LRARESALTKLGETRQAVLSERDGATPSGWDPYEVWRTRILLPRLVEQSRSTDTAAVQGAEVGAPRINAIDERSAGYGNVDRDATAGDARHGHEMIDTIKVFLMIGLASALLSHSERERRPTARRSLPDDRAVS